MADTAPKQPAMVSVEPNPSLQLDPALGLVVIQFRNDAGDVTASIPSERQLQAYQRWATTQFGPAPDNMPMHGGTADGAAPKPRVQSIAAGRDSGTDHEK